MRFEFALEISCPGSRSSRGSSVIPRWNIARRLIQDHRRQCPEYQRHGTRPPAHRQGNGQALGQSSKHRLAAAFELNRKPNLNSRSFRSSAMWPRRLKMDKNCSRNRRKASKRRPATLLLPTIICTDDHASHG